MSKLRKTITIFTLAIMAGMFILGLTGCGQTTTIEPPTTEPPTTESPYQAPPGQTYDETLTILTFLLSPPVHQGLSVIEIFAQAFMEQNQGTTIEIINMFDASLSQEAVMEAVINYGEHLISELMAGTAPVLLDLALVEWADPRINRFFADWYPVMRQDPNFDESNFYVNAFTAISNNAGGRLVAYPLSFEYFVATANITVQGLVNAARQYDYLSISDLHRLHQQFAEDDTIAITQGLRGTPDFVVSHHIADFVDIGNRTANFNNPEFIELIYRARELSRPGNSPPVVTTPEQEVELSFENLFNITSFRSFQYMTNLDGGVLFGSPVPLTNNSGEIVIQPIVTFALNANANPVQKALAWDFVKFMQENNSIAFPFMPGGVGGAAMPVYRPAAQEVIDNLVSNFWTWAPRNGHIVRGTLSEAQADVFSLLDGFNNIPMSPMLSRLGEISMVVSETIVNFQNHQITAEQAAEYLQNRVSAILFEMVVVN